MDLKEYLRQYTNSEIVLSENDFYVDGSTAVPEFKVSIKATLRLLAKHTKLYFSLNSTSYESV